MSQIYWDLWKNDKLSRFELPNPVRLEQQESLS